MNTRRVCALALLLVLTPGPSVLLGQQGDGTGTQKPTDLPKDTAILELDVPKGTQVTVSGTDRGTQTRFVFPQLARGQWYDFPVQVKFPGGGSQENLVLVKGGWHVRLPLRPVGGPGLEYEIHHREWVISAVFSQDGKQILTASHDRTAALWDAASGRRLLALQGHAERVLSAQFSPDGKQIVTASEDKTAALWDAASGRKLRALRGHAGGVYSAQFSPDGKQVLSASYDRTAALWDAASGRKLLTLQGHTGGVVRAQFSPDGKQIVTASEDKTAALWDAASGRRLRTFEGHADQVKSAQFDPDGKQIVTASADKTAALWDAATGRKLLVLQGHTDQVTSAQFSPDGKQIVTASYDFTGALWDAASGRRLRTLPGHTSWVLSAQFSPDGQQVVTASVDFSVALWDAASGRKLLALQGQTDQVWSAQFSPDGQQILTASADKTASLWDTTTGRRLRAFRGHASWVSSAWFSADGKQVLTASSDQTAALWDAASGRKLLTLQGHTAGLRSAQFSPDGKRIVTASFDKTAALWDTASGRKLLTLQGHTAWVHSAEFNTEGQQVLTASLDKTAALWDAASGKKLRSFEGHTSWILSARFSAEGQQVLTASADQTAALWDAATGRKLRALQGHTDRVEAAQFSPDGKQIVTASQDKTAALWDAASGRRLRTFEGHHGSVTCAAFSPDGRKVLTSSLDGAAHVWDVATGQMLAGLVTFRQSDDWLVVTPEGLFDGSADGRQKVHFRVGGQEVPVDRFFQDCYYPGLLAALWRGERPLPGATLGRARAPAVRIISPEKGGPVEQHQVTIAVEAADEGGGVKGPWLFHNGAKVLAAGPARVEGKVRHQTFTLRLVEGDNHLEVRAASGDGSWESEPARLTLRYERPLDRPELHVLAVGINKYANSAMNLKFAAQDAKALAHLFAKRGKALFQRVHVTTLLDEQATRQGIRAALKETAGKARPQDMLIVFVAGHGAMVGQRYYFVPHEFRRTAGKALEDDVRDHGLPGDVLGDLVAAVPALKRVLIFDTCHSGGAVGLARTARNPFAFRGAIERLSRAQGVFTIAATAAGDEAQEVGELGHGVLTYALLAGLGAVRQGPLRDQGLQPGNREGVATVLDWFGYASGQVPRLTRQYFGREQDVQTSGQGTSFPVLPVDDQ